MDSTFGDVDTVARQCAANTSIDFEKVANCTNSRVGNELQHVYAVQTESVKPTVAFVPWVTLNGNHTDDIQNMAETDLIGLLCKTYKVKVLNDILFMYHFCLGFESTCSM
jgi:interferon gamma-inducible protein 30